MFDKMFEEVARKRLTENAFSRLCAMKDYCHYDKLGAIIRNSNDSESVDVVRVHAHNLKKKTVMLGIVCPAAAVIGNILGNMNSEK